MVKEINLRDFNKVGSDNRDFGETWVTSPDGVRLKISHKFCLDLIENMYENNLGWLSPSTYAKALSALKTLRSIQEKE